MKYDLIIIVRGPAGVSAGVYASRKKIKTLVLAESFGGQSAVSSEIQIKSKLLLPRDEN